MMNGIKLAQKVVEYYGTANVEQLAKCAGVNVLFQRWHPVTYGEFNRKTKTITINLNAPLSCQDILAHELGHHFVDLEEPHLDKSSHEEIAESFAEALISQKLFP